MLRSRAFGLLLSVLLPSLGGCASAPPPAAPEIVVTLLGTGDPSPRLDRFGPATLVQTPDTTLLFDAGRGVMQRLAEAGVTTGSIDAIFLTHLHSDHLVGLPDLWLTGWVIERRNKPLKIYGPVGTRRMMESLRDAFSFDIDIRSSEARLDLNGIGVEVIEIEPGFVWQQKGVTVTAFAVDHRPVEPAFGFRIDAGSRSVALSGDTRYSESLIAHSMNTDVLIHEVSEAPEEFKRENPKLPRLVHHTQVADAARVFRQTRPRLAVYSHIVMIGGFDERDLVPLTRRDYDGEVVLGEDGMRILIGEAVTVELPGRK